MDEDVDEEETAKDQTHHGHEGRVKAKASEAVNLEKDKDAVLLQIINSGKSEVSSFLDFFTSGCNRYVNLLTRTLQKKTRLFSFFFRESGEKLERETSRFTTGSSWSR